MRMDEDGQPSPGPSQAYEDAVFLEGRRQQHKEDVEWLERYVLKDRILSNPVVIMGMETWKAFKNTEIS